MQFIRKCNRSSGNELRIHLGFHSDRVSYEYWRKVDTNVTCAECIDFLTAWLFHNLIKGQEALKAMDTGQLGLLFPANHHITRDLLCQD